MNGCIYCNEYDVCMKYTTDKVTSFCAGKNCRDRKPSNSDRIKTMTDEELAEWMSANVANYACCKFSEAGVIEKYGDNGLIAKSWLEWLRQEASDD